MNNSDEEETNSFVNKVRNNIRKKKSRVNETRYARFSRLLKQRDYARNRRAHENTIQKNQRNLNAREYQRRKRNTSNLNTQKTHRLSSSRKEELWTLVNQNKEPDDIHTILELNTLMEAYDQDVQNFYESLEDYIKRQQCSICGLVPDDKGMQELDKSNELFSSLQQKSTIDSLWYRTRYSSESNSLNESKRILVCSICLKHLKSPKHKVPRLSRANIPLPEPHVELRCLSFIEQMLISPILPMVFVWRYKSFGQYQSKGQCVAFCNKLQKIADVLPRTLSEVFVNVKDIYGHGNLQIRVKKVRNALLFLKENHPGYNNIRINEEIFISIEKEINLVEYKDQSKNMETDSNISIHPLNKSASATIRDAGQNQIVEEEVANTVLTAPLSVETVSSARDISNAIENLFKSISRKETAKLAGQSSTQGWSLMFPCLLWNGKGGPDSFLHHKLSLREWINYVIRIPSLDFKSNIIFISFANIVLRRKRITGLTAHKPISTSVEQAVKELLKFSHSNNQAKIPESTLTSLSSKVSAYVNELPGSLSDMRKFRNDILSMMKKHGAPTYFLTLSSADSMWPEGLIAASNDKLTRNEALELSSAKRADLMAENPIAMTTVWKKRVQGFLDMVINGKSQPLGEITHYVQKAEWQSRLSEHVHFLLWTKDGMPKVEVDENGDLKNESQASLVLKAEAHASSLLHFYPSNTTILDEYGFYGLINHGIVEGESQVTTDDLPSLGTVEAFNSVVQRPVSFKDYFFNKQARKSINDLVRSVNIHKCSAYCTNNGKLPCKSRFPFKKREKTVIKRIIDKNLNTTYRIHLQRNHRRVNPYSVPVINLWRANMDLTVLCGSPFASIVYVTYYTSKLDKKSNIRDVLQKIKSMDETSETKNILRKVLTTIDTCRITGLPEAAANLLLFPHRYTSSKILRLDTRAYLRNDDSSEDFGLTSSNALNSLLHSETMENDEFEIPRPRGQYGAPYTNENTQTKCIDKIARRYFERPLFLYDKKENKMMDSKQTSMTEYTENYKVTQKRKISNEQQSRDKKGRIVEPRSHLEQDIVLDLKYRVSPPDSQNPKWCAGSLALHVPHVSVQDLLTIDGQSMNITDAYNYYSAVQFIDGEGKPKALFPELLKFEDDEGDLYNATQKLNNLILTDSSENKNQGMDFCSTSDDPENEYMEIEELQNPQIYHDLDPDIYSDSHINALTELQLSPTKPWNGAPQERYLTAENPWATTNSNDNCSRVFENFQISEDHRCFMSSLIKGENPDPSEENIEAEEALLSAMGDRKLAGLHFIQKTMSECKNTEQRKAISKVVEVLEAYYFGNYTATLKKENLVNNPIITMIGVPGAGKSWVIRKIRTWIDIRFETKDLPYSSSESKILKLTDLSDPITDRTRECIEHLPEGKFGKSAAFAFSGSAAGIIKGFTIHHGFSFPVQLQKQIKDGELPLPELTENFRTRLVDCWSSVKLIIIDEVYMLKVEWLSLIDERLRQIFNSTLPFAGIPILISGDPRQIVPVNGRALFTISKYFDLESKEPELKINGISSLSEREEKGFKFYAASQFSIPLTKSVRLTSEEFSDLNMKIANYELSQQDVDKINKFQRPIQQLHESPWIDSPWLFPTWNEVNSHLQFVTERALKHKEVFRAWAPVQIERSNSYEQSRCAVKAFYTSSTHVTARFTTPLPYIDFFPGQIVCLKKNWNPKWNLFNNAKGFVVGIECKDKRRKAMPLMNLEEAINLTLEDHNALKFSLLIKPFLPFHGPSAIEDFPGIIEVPCVKVTRKLHGCKINVYGPQIFPANGFSHHQSQGSTFDRCVSCINDKCKAYGMANVVTSRTPRPEQFAITQSVTLDMLQPCPETSKLVEEEYVRLSKYV